MGRKLEFCRDKALHTAMESFWAQGYEHTSMRDLASKLGLHLGSVYNALGDKEKVFEAALKLHYQNHIVPELDTLVHAEDPLQAMDDLMVSVIAQCEAAPESPGCFFVNSLLEINSINDNVSSLVQEYMMKMETSFSTCLQNAQRLGQVPAARDAGSLARFYMGVLFSLRTMGKLNASSAHLQDIRQCTLRALKA